MRRCLLLLFLLVFFCGSAAADVFWNRPDAVSDGLEVAFFNCGEGDAIFLRCSGESMMVDGGPSGTRQNVLDGLRALNVEHFRYLLNTHFHDDHINGLTWIMRDGFGADEYLHPYNQHDIDRDDLCTRAVKTARKKKIPVRRLYNGDELLLGSASLKVFRCMEFSNANAKSLMIRVSFGRASMLLCADIIGETQKYFVETLSPELLKSDVIKIPHHGITPVDSSFLTVVDPQLAVMTNNQARSVPAGKQLERRNIPAVFSGEGAVFLFTDGTDWWVWQDVPDQP